DENLGLVTELTKRPIAIESERNDCHFAAARTRLSGCQLALVTSGTRRHAVPLIESDFVLQLFANVAGAGCGERQDSCPRNTQCIMHASAPAFAGLSTTSPTGRQLRVAPVRWR